MKPELFIGFDPSFTCFGVSVLDTEHKFIDLSSYKLSPGSKKLKLITWASLNIVDDIKKYLEDREYLGDTTYIAQESPAPRAPGSSLPMLWVLGSTVFKTFGSLSYYERISLYNVMSMRQLHNNKKHTKKDTMLIVSDILNILQKEFDYEVYIDGKFDDGMADSFIYALVSYIKFNEDELSKRITEKYPSLLKIKEEKD